VEAPPSPFREDQEVFFFPRFFPLVLDLCLKSPLRGDRGNRRCSLLEQLSPPFQMDFVCRNRLASRIGVFTQEEKLPLLVPTTPSLTSYPVSTRSRSCSQQPPMPVSTESAATVLASISISPLLTAFLDRRHSFSSGPGSRHPRTRVTARSHWLRSLQWFNSCGRSCDPCW